MNEILPNNEVPSLKKIIEEFIQSRLNDKLEKQKKQLAEDEVKLQEIKDSYLPENWVADAARRVKSLQLGTHAIKYHNPKAKGTEIYDAPKIQKNQSFVSSSTLTDNIRQNDVVGNAASLDVYKFLRLSHNNETLLSRAMRNDPALRLALSGTDKQKDEWINAFADVVNSQRNRPSSHTFAKQLYFSTGKDQYHILAPLFPSSLVHEISKDVQKRYDDTTKAARKAKKDNKDYTGGYRDYTNLAIQKFGGSKPQNISQLNSERKGQTFLLPSLPPEWKKQGLKPPLFIDSIFPKRFYYRVKDTIRGLKKFLEANIKNNNMHIRKKRARFIEDICDNLLLFAANIQDLKAGWSSNSNCKLSEAQKFWLDPERAQLDEEWSKKRAASVWQDEVCHDFARWLNSKLETKKLLFSDYEYEQWKKDLKKELSLLKEAL
jgi:CRISPR-associated protein Csy1